MRRHLNAFTASLSVHLFALASLIWLSAAAVREGARAAHITTPGSAAPPVLELSPPPPMSSAAAHNNERLQLPDDTGSSTLDIPNFTFDFGKIRRRAASLFPFLTDDIAFEPIRQIAARAESTSLPNPFLQVKASDGQPPLLMRDTTMQTFVDKIWSRRERWNAFQAIIDLTTRYSATDGQLPALLRRYAEQNLLQPYVETTVPDPRLWTMLGITADHSDFLDFILRYAAEHPSTAAATELLFMLDDMAQGSRDTLLALLDLDSTKDLWWTRTKNAEAFDLIVVLQRYYRQKLEARGIGSPEGVTLLHDTVRLSVLTAIAASTPRGYRADDARFLIGSIYWRHDRREEAVRWWRKMRVEKTNRYAAASAAILETVDGAEWQSVDPLAVKETLDTERRRWIDFWSGRLQKFGYTFSTY